MTNAYATAANNNKLAPCSGMTSMIYYVQFLEDYGFKGPRLQIDVLSIDLSIDQNLHPKLRAKV